MVEMESGNEKVIDATKQVVEYLSSGDEPAPSGAIFVVVGQCYDGGTYHSQSVKAAELYKSGFAPKVVLSSEAGANAGTLSKAEHEVYKEELLELGVPADAILARKGGNDTLKEATSGIHYMQEEGIDINKGILLTAAAIHARRAKQTWEMALQNEGIENIPLLMCPGVEEMDYNRVDIQERAQGEVLRLMVYARQKNLVGQPIPLDIKKSVAIIANQRGNDLFKKFVGYLPKN